MEAIIEFFVALLGALLELFAAGVGLLASLAMMILEFLFVLATGGLVAAKEWWSESKSDLDQRRADRNANKASAKEQPVSRAAMLTSGIALLAIILTSGGLWMAHQAKQRNIAAARRQVELAADQALHQLTNDVAVKPVPGPLEKRDAWGQPLELFIDGNLLGDAVTVRSAGPDGEPRTIDDIRAVRFRHADGVEIARELGKGAIDKAKQKAGGLLERFDGVKQIADDSEPAAE